MIILKTLLILWLTNSHIGKEHTLSKRSEHNALLVFLGELQYDILNVYYFCNEIVKEFGLDMFFLNLDKNIVQEIEKFNHSSSCKLTLKRFEEEQFLKRLLKRNEEIAQFASDKYYVKRLPALINENSILYYKNGTLYNQKNNIQKNRAVNYFIFKPQNKNLEVEFYINEVISNARYDQLELEYNRYRSYFEKYSNESKENFVHPFTYLESTITENPEYLDIIKQIDKLNQTHENISTTRKTTEFEIVEEDKKEEKNFTSKNTSGIVDGDNLIEAGMAGIHLSYQGRGYVFDAVWDHFIFIQLPSFDEKLIEKVSNVKCVDFIALLDRNLTKEIFTNRTDNLFTILNDTCISLENNLQRTFNNTVETSIRALQDFRERQLTRTKRVEPFTMVAIGAGILIAGWAIKTEYQIHQLNNQVEKLAKQVDLNTYNTMILKDKLIGLTNALSDSVELLNGKIDTLRETTELQINNLAYVLGRQIDKIHHDQYILSLLTFNTIFKMIKIQNLQQTNTLILDYLNVWDTIFGDLRRSVLSHSLFSWSKWKQILKEIRKKIEYNYELGISYKDHHLYYLLPLVSYKFDPDKNHLWLHIQVPLKNLERPQFYELVNVRPQPFPCSGGYCSIFGNETSTPEMLAFPITNTWLMQDKRIYREAYKTDFICQATGSREVCFTFQPHSLMRPSECSKAVIPFNSTKIIKECKFIQKDIQQYTPVNIGSNRYIIHSQLVPRYVVSCRGQKSKEIVTESYATVIEIESYCDVYLPSLEVTLKGPLEGAMHSNSTHEPKFYQLSLINDIYDKFNKTQDLLGIKQLIQGTNETYLREFNPEEYKINLEFDNERLTAISSYLMKTQNDLAQMVFSIDGQYGFSRKHFTIWSYLSMFGDFIRIMTTLVIIFGFITYSRFFGFFIAPVVIIKANRAAAFSSFTDAFLYQTETSIANSILAVIFIILLILCIKCAYFRTIAVNTYYGDCATSAMFTRYSLILNIHNRINRLGRIIIETIYVRIPLKNLPENLFDIKIRNAMNIWVIQDQTLKLCDSVKIYGINSQGHRVYNRNFEINIPLHNIKWESDIPVVVNYNQIFNLAITTVIRKSDISRVSLSEEARL